MMKQFKLRMTFEATISAADQQHAEWDMVSLIACDDIQPEVEVLAVVDDVDENYPF